MERCCESPLKALTGLFAWAEVLLILTYVSLTFVAFFWGAPNIYWPAWVSGCWDVAAIQAALAVQVWWTDDAIGVPALVAAGVLGVSMWLNISALIGLGWGAWTSNAVMQGAVTLVGSPG